jgi:hypothetical protein
MLPVLIIAPLGTVINQTSGLCVIYPINSLLWAAFTCVLHTDLGYLKSCKSSCVNVPVDILCGMDACSCIVCTGC